MTRSARMSLLRSFAVPLILLAAAHPTWAQNSDQHALGMQLFEQSCGVCHTKPTLTSPLYGPALSRDSLGGNAEAIREVISNGTSRMPGFKHMFDRIQIDAIVAYLQTMPKPAQSDTH